MIEIKYLRHEKEKIYLTIMIIAGVLIWLALLISTFGMILLFVLPMALFFWLIGLYFKAVMYGDSVKVTSKQYSEIHKLVVKHSRILNLRSTPDVFICNGNGFVNALAVNYLSAKYIILMSDLVDLMLKRNKIDELSMIIGHELGHHAAGHINPWKKLILMPATFIPLLGTAYGRACELTADRIGYIVTRNLPAAQNALVSIALGSESLANDTNIDEFLLQEHEMSEFMGFIHKVFSSHPRMTRRVIEITNYNKIQYNL